MSPEAYNENIYSEKSDIWALGIILHEMLTATIPIMRTTDIDEYFRYLKNMTTAEIIQSHDIFVTRNILLGCLTVDTRSRFGIKELREAINEAKGRLNKCKSFAGYENATPQLTPRNSVNTSKPSQPQQRASLNLNPSQQAELRHSLNMQSLQQFQRFLPQFQPQTPKPSKNRTFSVVENYKENVPQNLQQNSKDNVGQSFKQNFAQNFKENVPQNGQQNQQNRQYMHRGSVDLSNLPQFNSMNGQFTNMSNPMTKKKSLPAMENCQPLHCQPEEKKVPFSEWEFENVNFLKKQSSEGPTLDLSSFKRRTSHQGPVLSQQVRMLGEMYGNGQLQQQQKQQQQQIPQFLNRTQSQK